MTRLGALLLAAAAAGFVGAFAFGSPLVSLAFLVPGAGVAYWTRVRSRRAPEQQWSAPRNGAVGATDPQRGGGPVPSERVVRALGRVEARELATSPWFGAGAGFSLLVVLIVAISIDFEGSWTGTIQELPYLAHPLVGTAVLASHRNATRATRDGTEELFETCPAAPAVRTLGALWSAWVVVVGLAVFFAAYLALINVFSPNVRGPLESAAVANLFAGLVLGAGGVALGVALARFVRFPLAPVVAVILIGFASIQLAHGEPGQFSSRMLFSTFGPIGDSGQVDFTTLQAWGHLVWVGLLTAATGLVAVIGRHLPA